MAKSSFTLTLLTPIAKAIIAPFAAAAFAFAAEPVAPSLSGQLAAPFTDHAILQQKIPLPVWGTACFPGTKITVAFHGQTKQSVADTQGTWNVTLDPMTADKLTSVHEAPAGKEMVITFEKDGKNTTTTRKDLLIGEVWLCAGQSNIAGAMRTNTSVHHPANSIAIANYPAFRQLASGNDAKWVVCTPETAPTFKKVCFFFGRRVYEETLVLVGVISAAVGGSGIESWLNHAPYETGKNYTTLITPLIPFGIRGMIWYQGESNAKDGYAYLPKLTSLIHGWRNAWNQPDSPAADGPRGMFSFYSVQLPGIGDSTHVPPEMGDERASIRRAYHDALKIENTGMAICHDIGAKGEHPPNKYDTGLRLSQLALHRDYGKNDLIPSGPLYKDHKVEGHTIRIRFHHAEGLMVATKQGLEPAKPCPNQKIQWLSLQANDGTWHWADGKIDGTELIVSAPGIDKPTAVRYAFTNNPNGALLYNKALIPAAPFATNIPSP
jgi:sialate O-acetylesterase